MSVQAARLIAQYESQAHISTGGRKALLAVQRDPDTSGSQQTEIARILRDARSAPVLRPPRTSNAANAKDRLLKRFADEKADVDRRRLRADLDAALGRRGARGANLIAARDRLSEQLDDNANAAAVQAAVHALASEEPVLFESEHGGGVGRPR